MNQVQFWEIVSPIKKPLYGFAIRMLNDTQDAEDALQDVLEKLWKMRRKLEPDRNIKSLSMTIMKNKCVDMIKLKGRYVSDEAPIKERTVYSSYEEIDMINQLKLQMEVLPTQQKLIVELKDFQGFSYEEISEITQLSVNTLRVNLSRARKKLTETLRDEWR